MDILSLLFLAAALAMDAFSAAVTDGMIVKKIRFYDAIKVGLFFGVFQFLMPCIGNLVSGFATDIVERFDHWIAVDTPILFSSAVIGITAFLFSFGGVFVGKKFGGFLGSKAECIGGIILILIGVKTLVEHLY